MITSITKEMRHEAHLEAISNGTVWLSKEKNTTGKCPFCMTLLEYYDTKPFPVKINQKGDTLTYTGLSHCPGCESNFI